MVIARRAAATGTGVRHAHWARLAVAFGIGVVVPIACTDEWIQTATTAAGGATSSTSQSSSATATGSTASGKGGAAVGTTSAVDDGSSTGMTGSAVSTGTMTCLPSDSTCHPTLTCHGQVYQCGDTKDNDFNGLIDMDDPTCTGPCDNNEGGLYPNQPGQAGPPCKVDCFFGPHTGNDGCYWDHRCDSLEGFPSYYPESNHGALCAYAGPTAIVGPMNKTCADLKQIQSPQCLSTCLPLTPNGCDCFGCCELPAGTNHFVWLGSTNPQGQHCMMDTPTLLDPTLCQPCTPVMSCFKPCTKCEKCLGKAIPDPGCTVGEQCPAGVQPCGLPGQASCPTTQFCNTGCCYPLPG